MIPSLTPRGTYDKAELKAYLADAQKRKIPLYQVASELRVPRHRIVYLMGDGWNMIFGSRT